MASETLGFLANLSNSGAKLLLYYERRGLDESTVPEIMRICGIGSRTTYYKAQNELMALGFIGRSEGSTKTGLIGTESGLPTSPESVPASPKTVPVGVQKVYSGTESGLPDKSWLELAEDTDRLAGEGRREQAKRVIAEAWAEMFPETPVHINTVVQWLQAMQWMCSDVVGSMVVLQESNVALERRVGWMRKTVKNPLWKQKAKLTSATQTSEPMDDLENIEATYQFLIGKYGQAEADVWHAEQLARIGA